MEGFFFFVCLFCFVLFCVCVCVFFLFCLFYLYVCLFLFFVLFVCFISVSYVTHGLLTKRWLLIRRDLDACLTIVTC